MVPKLRAHGSVGDYVWGFRTVAHGVDVFNVGFHRAVGLYRAGFTQWNASVNGQFRVCADAKSADEEVSFDFFSASHDGV